MREWLTRKFTRQRLRVFLEEVQTADLILDVGASSNTLRDVFPRAIRSDIRLVAGNEGQWDAHALPFADASLPAILCTEVLEHCHTPQRVLDEFWRVLRPGGLLILTTRFVYPIHDAPHDYYRYTRYGLAHLCRAFSAVDIREEALTLETLAVLYQRLGYQTEWRVPGMRLAWFLLAKLLWPMQRLIRREYGDIHKGQPQKAILASGYYVVARK